MNIDLFNYEIIRQLGKGFRFWSYDDRLNCVWSAPSAFTICILENFVGEQYRGDSLFSKRMHDAVDTVIEKLDAVGQTKPRCEVLHHLCYALAHRSSMRSDFTERDGSMVETSVLALIIAVVAQYTDVIAAWTLSTSQMAHLNKRVTDFGTPLDIAISHGRKDTAQLLIEKGATIENHSWSWT